MKIPLSRADGLSDYRKDVDYIAERCEDSGPENKVSVCVRVCLRLIKDVTFFHQIAS